MNEEGTCMSPTNRGMTVHRPFVVVDSGPQRPWRDDLVGEDDVLTTRLRACILCGARHGPLDQTLVAVVGLCLATTRCLPCARQDPHLTTLQAFLVQRYGKGE